MRLHGKIQGQHPGEHFTNVKRKKNQLDRTAQTSKWGFERSIVSYTCATTAEAVEYQLCPSFVIFQTLEADAAVWENQCESLHLSVWQTFRLNA